MTPRRLCSWTMCLAALQTAGFFFVPALALAATQIPLTVNMSEAVVVTGTPRVAVDVGGQTRYATYTSGSTTSALVFTLTPQSGDLDLDGITVSSPIQLNGGTIKDIAGNDATLTFMPPNTSGIKVSVPSLSMDFVADADGRYTLNGTAYNDLTSFLAAAGGTFTRASTATYFDSTGVMQIAASGAPRFDYDPTTLQPKGLLMEGSRSNLFPYSAQFDNASWLKSVSTFVTANQDTAPNGTVAADYFYATDPSGSWPALYRTVSVTANTDYTFSIWAKGKEWTNLTIQAFGNGTTSIGSSGNFTLSTSAYTRYKYTFNSGIYTSVQIRILFSGAAQTWTGTQGMHIWGAQLEASLFPTSYIPTTTAAVTRSSDVLTVPAGGWYNAAAGVFMTAGSLPYLGGANWPGFAALDDGTGSNAMHLFINDAATDAKYYEIFTGGVGQSSYAGGTYTAGAITKMAIGYEANNVISAMDGTQGPLDTTVTLPAVTTLRLGYARGGSSPLNGHIRTFKYYPLRAASAQIGLLSQ